MADKKPFIAARLRNPSEVNAAPVKAKQDYIGGIVSIVAFLVAAATLAILYLDWDTVTLYTGR